MAYLVAGALFSESFAVLALTCYVLLSFHVIMGLLPRDVSRPEPPDRASQQEQPPMRTAEPQLGPGSRLRREQVTPAKVRKEPNLLLSKEPPAERSSGCNTPALLDAATLPAVQATALDRMVANTRKAPKTPHAPSTQIRFRAHGVDSAGAWEVTHPTQPRMRRPASEPSLGVIELSANQTGMNKAKEPAGQSCMRRSSSHESLQLSSEIAIHGDALASRLAFKLQQVEEQLARARRSERRAKGLHQPRGQLHLATL
jgi:hypothetical protein